MTKEVEVRDQSRVDSFIWKYVNEKSSRDIAEMTGEKPEYILRRKKELLEEIDELTIKESRQALIVNLQIIARKTQEDYDNSPWEMKSGLMNSAIAAMKLMMSEMARLEKSDDEKVVALNSLRRREIVNLYVSVVDKGVKEMANTYGIPEDDLFEIFNGLLMVESARIDS